MFKGETIWMGPVCCLNNTSWRPLTYVCSVDFMLWKRRKSKGLQYSLNSTVPKLMDGERTLESVRSSCLNLKVGDEQCKSWRWKSSNGMRSQASNPLNKERFRCI